MPRKYTPPTPEGKTLSVDRTVRGQALQGTPDAAAIPTPSPLSRPDPSEGQALVGAPQNVAKPGATPATVAPGRGQNRGLKGTPRNG